jgi:hypothetical protein
MQMKGPLLQCLEGVDSLPDSFLVQISDRMSVGMSIILRVSYEQLTSPSEWRLVGNLIHKAALGQAGWGFVLDGIASFVEQCVHVVHHGNSNSEQAQVSKDGTLVLMDILINFLSGVYPCDTTACSGVLPCLQILHSHLEAIEVISGSNSNGAMAIEKWVLPVALWQNMSCALFRASLLAEADASRIATEELHRITLAVSLETYEPEAWLALLNVVASEQPPIENTAGRLRACDFLGKVLLVLAPHLSKSSNATPSSWNQLTTIVNRSAGVFGTNLQEGRRKGGKKGSSSLFESTVQFVTNISNVLFVLGETSLETDGNKEFVTWAGEVLLLELQNAGAAGGSIRTNVVVPNQQKVVPKEEEEEHIIEQAAEAELETPPPNEESEIARKEHIDVYSAENVEAPPAFGIPQGGERPEKVEAPPAPYDVSEQGGERSDNVGSVESDTASALDSTAISVGLETDGS